MARNIAVIVSAFLLLVWVIRLLFIIRLKRRTQWLKDTQPPENYAYPKLSVIIPARDEAAKLDAALDAKLKSDYPEIEFILIDDRSSDGTGEIIDRAAAADRRVKTLHVTALPPGWLGKVNALNKGAAAATGEWLLFSDADVHFGRDALKKAVYYAEQNGLDHLGVMPEIWTDSFIIAVMLVPMLDTALRWASWRSDVKSKRAVGIGAFNMVRSRTFRKTPGFEYLRLEVIDDMGLGLMMKESGFKGAAVHGRDCVGLCFLKNLREARSSCDKGVFAGIGFSYAIALLAFCGVLFIDVLPFALAFFSGPAGKIAVCVCCVAIVKCLLSSKSNNRPLLPAFFLPVGSLLGAYFLLHAMLVTFAAGGVRWRDTVYPLGVLKAGKRFWLKNFY